MRWVQHVRVALAASTAHAYLNAKAPHRAQQP